MTGWSRLEAKSNSASLGTSDSTAGRRVAIGAMVWIVMSSDDLVSLVVLLCFIPKTRL